MHQNDTDHSYASNKFNHLYKARRVLYGLRKTDDSNGSIHMATTWKIDPTHSAIHFTVRHMVFAKVRGTFGVWQAELRLDSDDLSRSELAVEIDAKSIDTGVADRDTHLRSGDFLDVETHPKLTFKSTRIEKGSDKQLKLTGDLTIHGKTRPVVLEVERLGEGTDPWGSRRSAARG
jgi:polyisoprenoid-binding protein YceI